MKCIKGTSSISKNIFTNLIYWKSPEDKEFYSRLAEFSTSTFKDNLAGQWEYHPIETEIEDKKHDIAFHKVMRQIRLWCEQGYNVLFCDTDVICVKPVEIFEKYKHIVMFWHTEAHGIPGCRYHLNRGVLYCPKEIPLEIWEYGEQKWQACLSGGGDSWGQEQVIWNQMMHQQDVDLSQFLKNEYHYMVPVLNTIKKEEAAILHYWITRGSREATYQNMVKDYEELNQSANRVST